MSKDAMRHAVFGRQRGAWRRAIALPVTLITIGGAVLTATSSAAATLNASRAHSGGTVTFALPPGDQPDMILPFFSSEYVGFQIPDFLYLMYRPLYYFSGKSFQLTETNSLAYPPTYNASDTAVTVKLKPWSWSDGEKLSVTDIAFFMGLVKTETATWWAHIPGDFPTNVASTTYDAATDSFTFHLKHSVNQTWFTDNQLDVVQPMPLAWDLSGPNTKADCSDKAPKLEVTACAAVYKYLEHEASDTSTYATNPLWQVVDGPFRLSSFSPGGSTVVLAPNKKYSGPDKAKISAFKLETFTSDAAEYDVLKSGTSITVGFLPYTDAPAKPNDKAVGANPVSGYTLDPWFNLADNYIDINYNNPTIGPIEHQLYFRQAVQSLVDQQAWIKVAFKGYAYADYGPVPPAPATNYLTKYAENDPYPFSVGNARHYLTSHGWTIPSSGPATCTKPGTGQRDCGAGISKGQKLTMTLIYASGTGSLQVEMETFQSTARQAGLYISLRAEPIDEIFTSDAPCTPKQSGCSWQMLYFGGPVTEEPFWYPDTGLGYQCHSDGNTENFCTAKLDSEYAKYYSEKGVSVLHTLEDEEIKQCIVVAVPVQDEQLTEVTNRLGGYTQSGTADITPQDWYFKS
jgi:peptide/nickel transport system substrate-binding protein